MNISVFGLGYVGSVSAAVLADRGHQVIGVDPNKTKIDLINAGNAIIVEPGLEELTAKAVKQKKLRAICDARTAILATEITFICVGTPCQADNSLDLRYVKQVCEEIGTVLKEKTDWHLLVFRSTMFPGSMRNVVIPLLEKSAGKKAGGDFSVCFNPEFMMEGTAIYDFSHPPKNVVGADDQRAFAVLSKLNRECTNMETICLNFESAELVKYCDNVWHALKVGFANEIGKVCKALKIDSHVVMDVFCQDTKLNLSSYYLKPGFAFGGSCLPKDLRAFLAEAKKLGLRLPIIDAVLPSNQLHIEEGLAMIVEAGHKQIGILGFSFKANTDDLRESPIITLIEQLLSDGYELTLYDKNVAAAKKSGANRDYLTQQIPHIANCMVASVDDVLARAKTIVIGNKGSDFENILERINDQHIVIDLVRIQKNISQSKQYNGICW